jgi:outer membrane protein assembly factor BamB
MATVFLTAAACALFRPKADLAGAKLDLPLAEAKRLRVYGLVNPIPVAAGRYALFTTRSGIVHAVDPEAGSVPWTFTAGAPVVLPPAVGDGWVVLADETGVLYGLDGAGKALWRRPAEGPAPSDLLASDGRLILRSGATSLAAFDALTGGHLWRVESEADTTTGLADWNGSIISGTSESLFRIVGRDGRLLRTFPASGIPAGPLVVRGDLLFAGYVDGRFACLDLAKGKLKWAIKLGAVPAAPAAIEGRRVYVALLSNVLFCLEARSGTVLWWKALPGWVLGGPVLVRDKVLVPASSPGLTAYSAGKGEPAPAFLAEQEIRAGLLRIGEKFFVGYHDPDADRSFLLILTVPPPAAPPASAEKKEPRNEPR